MKLNTPYPEQQLAYTIPESIRILRISRASLYRLFNDGALKSKKIGGRRLITHKEIELFLGLAA